VGGDELVDGLARSARECDALRGAVVLAGWVGEGRAVTAKGVLRRVDVPAAGRVLGVELPERVRSAADVSALHWPWTAALGAGLLSVDGGRAASGQALSGWRSAMPGEVLELWARGFVAALTDLFDDDEGSEALEIGRLALTVLVRDPVPAGVELADAVSHAVLDARLYGTFDRGFGTRDPAEVTVELLAAFGAVTELPEPRRITSLGHWALSAISTRGKSLLGSSDGVDVDGAYQLKIVLQHVRPACWRRVLMSASATLGDLHEVIQIAFAWDGDHLHGFTVGRRRYGDPYFDAEYDEDEITLVAAFRARKPISYTYDFGDDWRHEITLEKVVEPVSNPAHPVCVGGRGNAPVEDCGYDEPAWITFDQADINTSLDLPGFLEHGRVAAEQFRVGGELLRGRGGELLLRGFGVRSVGAGHHPGVGHGWEWHDPADDEHARTDLGESFPAHVGVDAVDEVVDEVVQQR
jgi:hypothetical protein